MVVDEWLAQDEDIAPESMPATRAANSAIDKVTPNFDGVVDMLAAYAGTDLISYRADGPDALVAQQAEAWDPYLAYAKEGLELDLRVTAGIIPIDQPEGTEAACQNRLKAFSVFELTAVHDLITLSGSYVVGMAAAGGHVDAEKAWADSTVDDRWQEAQWGFDEEASALLATRKESFLAADRFLVASRVT
jgi:chaperone required for assembly of F1-ATPase